MVCQHQNLGPLSASQIILKLSASSFAGLNFRLVIRKPRIGSRHFLHVVSGCGLVFGADPHPELQSTVILECHGGLHIEGKSALSNERNVMSVRDMHPLRKMRLSDDPLHSRSMGARNRECQGGQN